MAKIMNTVSRGHFLRYSAVARGEGHGVGGPDPLKICRKGQNMF